MSAIVNSHHQASSAFSYQDGSESALLKLFKSQPTASQVSSFLAKNSTDWPLTYHLSPQRHLLLEWCNFQPEHKLLEVGAGCGALTGLFLDRQLQVSALEPDPNRYQVLQARFPEALFTSQLTTFPTTLENFQPPSPQKFDYLSVVGILEYVKQTSDPLQFLTKAITLLKKNGTLILAIENRLDLKYFAGQPEVHTNQNFSALNNYPHHPHLETFSQAELINLLQQVGFNQLEFYFPFPDYKFPHSILSSAHLQDQNHSFLLNQLFDHTSLSPEAQTSFSQPQVSSFLKNSQLLPNFAPSFLVFASQNQKSLTSLISSSSQHVK